MNPNNAADPGSHNPDSSAHYSKTLRAINEHSDIDILEWLAIFWEKKYLIIGCMAILMMVGWFALWKATPIYQADAMLQITIKKDVTSSDAVFAKIGSLFSETTEAQAEIEVIRSSLILGRTVETLGLDIVAKPKVAPIIGAALLRRNPDAPRIEIDSFVLPDALKGEVFNIVVVEGNAFRWEAPKSPMLVSVQPESLIAIGKPGESISGQYGNQVMRLKVRSLNAQVGQQFVLYRQPLSVAIEDLRSSLEVVEKGKLTNIIGVSLENPDPVECSVILNELINQYFRHIYQRKMGEASKAISILQEQIPSIKAKLDEAEARLNHFRSSSGSIDVSREGDLLLQQSSAIVAQISALKQKKEELLRTYQENSDVVSTLNGQIRKLQNEVNQIDSKLSVLPGNQQEVIRLTREVQVNTDLYTAMLNNYKQLQVATTGDIGNVSVVDPAVTGLKPIRPKKMIWMTIFSLMGFIVGVGLTVLFKALRHGIEDHRLIESSLGLPVFVTIPHSDVQEEHDRSLEKREDGVHLISYQNPDDLATESMRNLRTMLHISMEKSVNRVIMVTGPSPGSGKSFISCNLAAVIAQSGARVLLIDGDMRRGRLHHHFGIKGRMGGLSDVLSGRMDWKSVVCPLSRTSKDSDTTEIWNLNLMKTGIIPPNPSELLMTERFAEFITAVSNAYDYVIIDTPALLAVADAGIIGSKAGISLLVAKYGQHTLDELRTCKKRLGNFGVVLEGCIFNDVRPMSLGYGNREYKYAYHYQYKSK
jgi:tyrosine-protein kinase Etk/Wzc